MNPKIPLLVFTDLDGSLLSHTDYRWDAAAPALDILRGVGAGIILASSKTAPEIITLRQQLSLQNWPAIVENGAGVLAPNSQSAPENTAYARLRAILNGLPADLRAPFRGFGDMDESQIATLTGLNAADAGLARQRAFSEPGLWSGTAAQRGDFLNALAEQGVTGREGGRFLTLSFGQTKADQMAQIIAAYKPHTTVALGDAPNDVEMLETADFGVIIANPHRDPLPVLAGEKTGRIIRTTQVGPAGWNTAMLDLIKQLDMK